METDLYGGRDPRELPLYSVPEAAHYLRIPVTTLRNWVAGQIYSTTTGEKRAKPLIETDPGRPRMLSFLNVVEAHVLAAIRRDHGVSMWKVRRVIDTIQRELKTRHPLADERFRTDGVELFVERFGRLVRISSDDQVMIRQAIERNLSRVEWDARSKLAFRFFPYVFRPDEPRLVVMDVRRSFGRPILDAVGVPTAEIAERRIAGESVDELARDFNISSVQVEEALRYELRDAA